ncbi:MAG: DNA-directed DNA polymerase [Candidatus Pacearchaeota archaeon]
MLKTNFIPIDYGYFDYKGKNYIKIIGRDDKGKRVCVIDTCSIYLWAVLKKNLKNADIDSLVKKIEGIKLDTKGRKTKVEKVKLCDKKFLGNPVKALKIFATNHKDLHDIANQLDFPEIECRRGYDIGFTTHYIIEKKINPLKWYEISGEFAGSEFQGIENLDVDLCIKLEDVKKIEEEKFVPKILAYDIETDELKVGAGKILMISLVSKNYKKVISWKKTTKKKADYVEYVKNESELLERFIEEVREVSPDILVGYNSDGFDLPYLKSRSEKHNIKLSLGLDDSQPRFTRGSVLSGRINGIVHLDILKFIRTTYSQYMKSETLSLNEVSKEFLDNKKKEFKPHEINNDEINWAKFFEYNLHDSVLTLGLAEKFWPDLLEFSRVIKEPLFKISRNGLSKQVESYILHNLENFDEIPERRPSYNEIGKRRQREKVEGAFVFEPKPGLYENIALFDFTSMHTSIIISMNISKETFLERKEKNSIESPEINYQGKKTKYYFTKKPGFIPLLLRDILEKRKEYKKKYQKDPNPITKARSNAFKLLSASVHGYIGFFGARYHSIESSATILAFVRKFNKEIIEKVQKLGHEVIFGDTDSIGFLRNGKSKKEIIQLLENLNEELPGVMKLELEGFFKRGLWVAKRTGKIGAKKKYALLREDGKLKIRGFETVRRDWCNLARKVQNKIIKKVLEDGEEKSALKYLKSIIKKVKNREVELEDLIIRTKLKKSISAYKSISPHVVAAKRMKELEIPISEGGIVSYYLAETNNKSKLVRDKVKLPEEKGKYEIEYYLKKQVLPAVENIFEVFGISTKELIEGKRQTQLGDF